MDFLSIVVFVIITYGLGLTASFFVSSSSNIIERTTMRMGLGLSAFILAGVILNLLHIAVDWRILLLLSLIYPAYHYYRWIQHRKYKQMSFTVTKEHAYSLAALAIACFALFMYASGAFSYPYLEDDDPWHHADSVSYVSHEKTLFAKEEYRFKYLDPYPPGYDLIMGVLKQASDSLSWTLKFYNALFLSLGILFFYFAAKELAKNRQMALFSTFVLASLPSFFTHFIWAHTLVIILFFPALYCLEKIEQDKKWAYPAALAIVGILLTHSEEALKLMILMSIYVVIKSIYYKSIQREIIYSMIGGLLLSMVWWYNKAFGLLTKHSSKILTSTNPKYNEIVTEASTGMWGKIKATFPYNQGTATRAYTFDDFFVAKSQGMINVHVGWGIVVSILLIIGIIYLILKYKELLLQKEKYWVAVALLWLVFTFLGTNSMTFHLPVGLFAFRFWLILAIPVALLSWFGLDMLQKMGKSVGIPAFIILLVVVSGIAATSTAQKYQLNHNPWGYPGGGWTSQEELKAYLSLKTLPLESKVYSYGQKAPYVLGMDQFMCQWCDAELKLRKEIYTLNGQDLYGRLRSMGYEYLVVDVTSISMIQHQQNVSQDKAQEILNSNIKSIIDSGNFVPIHSVQNGAGIFRLR